MYDGVAIELAICQKKKKTARLRKIEKIEEKGVCIIVIRFSERDKGVLLNTYDATKRTVSGKIRKNIVFFFVLENEQEKTVVAVI